MAYDQDPDYLAALSAYNRGLATFQTALANGNGEYWNQFANLTNVLTAIQNGSQPASAARSGSVTYVNNFLAAATPAAAVTARERDPSTAAYVHSLYRTYLNREPDAAGWEFWTAQIVNGQHTRDSAMQAFANEAAAIARAQAAAVAAAAATPGTTVPVVTPTPAGTAPVVAGPFLGGILEGKLFGVDKTVLLGGGLLLWFLMSDGKGSKR